MDPPYASGARTEAQKKTSGAMLRNQRWNQKPITNDQMTTPGFIWFLRENLLKIYPLLSEGGSVLSFIDWRQWPNLIGAIESTNLRINNLIVWDKKSFGLGHGFRSQHELICHASKGTPNINKKDCGNVLRFEREKPIDHPSPKPKKIINRLLQVVTSKNEMVLDPFMGSGSTLSAVKDLGRKAIGIEIEEKYCEIAAKRMAQEVLF